MDYQIGDNAFAVKTEDEWILKPLCDSTHLAAGANGVAVCARDGWVLTPAAKAGANENAITVRDAANDPILLPLGCQDGGGCTGQDPLCSNCPCTASLRQTYTISLSGFPAICAAENFNGVWTVTWERDCFWSVYINPTQKVTLSLVSLWTVGWGDELPGGASGGFYSSGQQNCRPDSGTWSPGTITEPIGCDGLSDAYFANAACIVS